MENLEAIKRRHAVRRYTDQPIDTGIVTALRSEITKCNTESGLHIQLITNDPGAFGGFLARYGNFRNVKNYIALVGKPDNQLEENAGYYGERIVLAATALGLDSCWVALTFSKKKCKCQIQDGEKLVCVIAIGYGETHGTPHKSKSMDLLYRADEPIPAWFIRGMEAAILAPTALNQQKFLFTLSGNTVKATASGAPYSNVDLGIVKYHFEIGAGTDCFSWA